MAKKRQGHQVARWSNTQSLGHTATTRRRLPLAMTPTVRFTLMRTVLGDTAQRKVSPIPRPALTRFLSPTVSVRASGRSSQKRIRSPFLIATAVTPQLTERSLVCARRHIRREVLFATKRTNGSGARKKRSSVRC